MSCKICLHPISGNQRVEGYHTKCLEELFGNSRVSPYLKFNKKQFVTELPEKFTKGMSISGVQKKLSMTVKGSEVVPIDVGGHYILKPTVEDYPELSENEHLSMKIGEKLGIETPPCGLIHFSDGERAYLVKRFDRGEKKKILKEDMTQVFGMNRDVQGKYKYSNSYEEVGIKLLEVTGNKLIVVLKFFERLLYNYVIQNGDYHLKNISVQTFSPNRSGQYEGLTPNYDSVMTRLYFKNEPDTALEFLKNGEFTKTFDQVGYLTRSDFDELAQRLGLSRKATETFYTKLSSKKEEILALVRASYLSQEMKKAYESNFLEYFGRIFRSK